MFCVCVIASCGLPLRGSFWCGGAIVSLCGSCCERSELRRICVVWVFVRYLSLCWQLFWTLIPVLRPCESDSGARSVVTTGHFGEKCIYILYAL